MSSFQYYYPKLNEPFSNMLPSSSSRFYIRYFNHTLLIFTFSDTKWFSVSKQVFQEKQTIHQDRLVDLQTENSYSNINLPSHFCFFYSPEYAKSSLKDVKNFKWLRLILRFIMTLSDVIPCQQYISLRNKRIFLLFSPWNHSHWPIRALLLA